MCPLIVFIVCVCVCVCGVVVLTLCKTLHKTIPIRFTKAIVCQLKKENKKTKQSQVSL